MRGVTDYEWEWRGLCNISIHTPHAGSDPPTLFLIVSLTVISIHTPHAGSDATCAISWSSAERFQSTLPMRGVTAHGDQHGRRGAISIHTPHAGSDRSVTLVIFQPEVISIHTPHAGSDLSSLEWKDGFFVFQSTLPMRGVTTALFTVPFVNINFNPHSPCGE